MSTRQLVRWNDGDRFAVAVEISAGTKWRHLLTMSEAGLRIVDVPLDEKLFPAGDFKPRRHLAAFRRFAVTFGSTGAARDAVKLLADEAAADKVDAADEAPA